MSTPSRFEMRSTILRNKSPHSLQLRNGRLCHQNPFLQNTAIVVSLETYELVDRLTRQYDLQDGIYLHHCILLVNQLLLTLLELTLNLFLGTTTCNHFQRFVTEHYSLDLRLEFFYLTLKVLLSE